MIYCSRDIERQTEIGNFNFKFCPFTPLKTQKVKNFQKDIIILCMCAENHNHVIIIVGPRECWL